MTVAVLTWSPDPESIFGPRTLTLSAGACDVGSAYPRPARKGRPNGSGFAHAMIAGRYLCHEATTLTQAVKALQRDIDRQSIGLFGLDAIRFEGFPA